MSGDFEALALRVEQAEGPDRELDAAIALGIGKKATVKYGHPALGNEYSAPAYFERYTASVDAALTLVPEVWRLRQMNFSAPCADNRKWTLNLFGGKEGGRCSHSEAATPALALCAAALRARAS